MKSKKQNADFVCVGRALLGWYDTHGRALPFRETRDPYTIWIAEIIFQQTRISQGLLHFENFIRRFPTIASLANAETDEVLLCWKGLGYYSRALNLHFSANDIMTRFGGRFPSDYEDILSLKGVGKYTAAAICSIAFGGRKVAVDGNLYRVLARLFADDFDIARSQAFDYFSSLALQLIPEGEEGHFNQAMMDLGATICKPRNPECGRCPLRTCCLAFATGTVQDFPVKTKKTAVTRQDLTYYFIVSEDRFLVRQRGTESIWKKLYEFPDILPSNFEKFITAEKVVMHKLTHRILQITFKTVVLPDTVLLQEVAENTGCSVITFAEGERRSFPKPLQNYFEGFLKTPATEISELFPPFGSAADF